MFDNEFQRKSRFRGFDQEEEKPDAMTKSMYDSQKYVYNMVKSNMDRLSPAARKHFMDISIFIDKYERDEIKHWYEFYKISREIYDEWQNLTLDQYKAKVARYEAEHKGAT